MNQNSKSHKLLFRFLLLLVLLGILIAATGVYIVDGGVPEQNSKVETYHTFDPNEITVKKTNSTIHGAVYAFYFQNQETTDRASKADKGLTIGELMRWAGILSILTALCILIWIEFLYKKEISRLNYRTLMMVSMFALPLVIVLGTGATVLETTKTVESCASCHVMDPFVNDLFNPESTTLAARHYKNRWISEYQCYTCHTTYGAHGTFEGKRDGFRHWLLFVTRTWDEPISYSGSYPNQNCTTCHVGTQKFSEVPSHRALSPKLRADEVSCTSCHGPAHPTPPEREFVPDRMPEHFSNRRSDINNEELTKLKEAINGLNINR